MDENIYNKVSDIYTKSGYFSRYSLDIWITIILCLVVFYVIAYFYVMNHLHPIKKNWATQRCNPAVIPFAGIINNNTDKSNFDFTKDNFEHCTQTILGDITKFSFTPIYYLMNLITTEFKDLSNSLNDARSMFNNIRNDVEDQGKDIYGRSLNITLPIIHTFQTIKDIFGKAQATMVSGIYTLYGGYITTNSLFLYIYEATLSLLYIIISFIIACFAVGWLFPPTLIAGMSAAAFMTILLIPIVVIMTIVTEVFDAADIKAPPAVPGYCFAGDTEIPIFKRTSKSNISREIQSKKIKKIKVGDILSDGSTVTATMKSSSSGLIMYTLDGVIVTSEHMVFHTLYGWIPVKSHPKAIKINQFKDQYVYCLNTDTKTIRINNNLFTDWDEIDEKDLQDLREKTTDIDLGTPTPDLRIQINQLYDAVIHPDTFIYLQSGEQVRIKNMKVNDILLCGEIVKSIVKIKTKNMKKTKFFNYYYNGSYILSANENINIHIYPEMMDYTFNDFEKLNIDTPDYGYHIITDKGEFQLNGVLIKDYNDSIEKFL